MPFAGSLRQKNRWLPRKESDRGPYAIKPGYISYKVYVEAPDFAKMRLVKQHQLVTRALSSQIKDMHGIRISTAVSAPS